MFAEEINESCMLCGAMAAGAGGGRAAFAALAWRGGGGHGHGGLAPAGREG